MKKIMFDDRYGLTKAVLEGRKTMTRRIVPSGVVSLCERGMLSMAIGNAKYKPGEVVAVAQAYKHVFDEMMRGDYGDDRYDAFKNHYFGSGEGWHNKMFVCADFMPHQISITNIRIERLQDISDEDCLREGIEKDGDVYSFNDYEGYKTPKLAFKALINRISGKGTWERNPWVFVYEFELVK